MELEEAVAIKKSKGEPILLHLGCGGIYLGGWINCDIESEPPVVADVILDCSKIPLPDNSVQAIYSSHLIEHFDYKKGQEVLKEWYRVLVPDGKFIIETPDMLGLCQRFVRSNERERIDLYGLFFGMPWAEKWNIHKFLYSETQLRWTMETIGFKVADSHYVPLEKTDVFLKLEAIKGVSGVPGVPEEIHIPEINWRHPLGSGWSVHQKPTELMMLSDFLKKDKIKKVLEIGSANGGTAVYWVNMMGDDGLVYSIDIIPIEKCYKGSEFEKQIVEILGDSHDESFKQKIFDEVGEVDMLFIDGDHSYEGVKDDFNSFSPLVKENGFIVIHDIIDSEYHRERGCFVAKFWNELKDKYKATGTDYHIYEFIDPTIYPEVQTPVLSMGIGVVKV
jgi:predicted SAM-dependent methyltransferase/cephalosporin hydroxylase